MPDRYVLLTPTTSAQPQRKVLAAIASIGTNTVRCWDCGTGSEKHLLRRVPPPTSIYSRRSKEYTANMPRAATR